MKSSSEKGVELVFLRDDPINDASLDEFKHASVAETLEDIIHDASTPLTIGLFANWGVGKSGVSNLLSRSLKSKGKVACIEFDVWKYEDETALRRQFLYNLDEQLRDQGLAGDYKLTELLDKSISRDVNEGVTLDPENVIRFIMLLLIIVFAGVFIDNQLFVSAATLIAVIAVIPLRTFFSTGLAIVKNKKRTVTQSRITASDEFEQIFHKIIDSSKAEKIIVILDNLDRVTEEKAVILLSTVKSFLEYKKCIYLVPCDEGAIKKHLRNVYNYQENGAETTADEFLRKFFNSYIRIPNFIDADLQVYTEKYLRQTNFDQLYPSIENLATVITSAYRENPRQIKQFINIFLAHYLLAKKREDDNDMPTGEVTSNPEFLAKILIIQQKWHTQHVEILQGKSLLEVSGPDDYKVFLTGSSLTQEPPNIKSFLYLKRSLRASNLPPGAAESLQTAVEDAKLEDVRNFIDKILESDTDHTKQLNDFFREILENATRGNRRQIIINIIKSLNVIWLDKKFSLDNLLLQRINKAINDNLFPEDLFATNELFVTHSLTVENNKNIKSEIALKYLNTIDPNANGGITLRTENIMQVLVFVEKNEKLFTSKGYVSKLSESLKESVGDPYIIKKILETDALLKLLQPTFINEMVVKLTKADMDLGDGDRSLYELKSELLIKSPNTETAQINQHLESIRAIISGIINNSDAEFYLPKLCPPFLDVLFHKQDLLVENDYSKNMIDTLLGGYNSRTVFEEKGMLLKPLLLLRGVADDAERTNIQSFLEQQVTTNVETAEDFLTDTHFENLFNDIRSPLEDKAINFGPFINVIWTHGDDDARISLIDRLFSTIPNTALSYLDERVSANDLPKDIEALNSIILRHAKQASITERQRYYERVRAISTRISTSTRNLIVEQILELAKNTEPIYQTKAKELYDLFKKDIPKTVMKDVSKQILTWLDSQARVNSNLMPSIELVLISKADLNNDDLRKLAKVILDSWAIQESDENQINIIKQLDVTIPKKIKDEYYSKIDERARIQPHMAAVLNELKDRISSDW